MLKIISGAVAGFVVWTIFLLVSDQIWLALSPDWYGRHQNELVAAINNKTVYAADSAILMIAVVRSAIFSILTGAVAALISKEYFKSPLLLGIFLFAFGGFVHSMILDNVPLWYHALILLPLVPLTIFGGSFVKRNQTVYS